MSPFLLILTLAATTAFATFPSFLQRATSCSPSSPCTALDTYCPSSSNICGAISYTDIVQTSPTPTPVVNPPADLNIIVFTDVQYKFKKCKTAPQAECIYYNLPKGTSKVRVLKKAAKRELKCIEAAHSTLSAELAFDLGDITSFGKSNELKLITGFHQTVQGYGLPLAVCLGNHDYFKYGNEPGVRMVNYLYKTILDLHAKILLSAIDWKTSGEVDDASKGGKTVYWKGSLCYTVEKHGFVFLIMHWAFVFQVGQSKSLLEYTQDGIHYSIQLTDPEPFIRSVLADAQVNNKHVVLMPHAYKWLKNWVSKKGMESFLDTHPVLGVVSGHVHDAYGKEGDWNLGGRSIPVYYAGSTTYEKFLSINLNVASKVMSVDVYDSHDGRKCSTTTKRSTSFDVDPTP